MPHKAIIALAAFVLGTSFSTASQAEDIKLYVFSSGALTIGKGVLQNMAPMTPEIQVPVGFFVVKHPRGNVLFDTGNNDNIIKDPSYWGDAFKALKPVNTPDVAIDAQLQKIGLKPDDIKYVVVSHLHLDHGGNVGEPCVVGLHWYCSPAACAKLFHELDRVPVGVVIVDRDVGALGGESQRDDTADPARGSGNQDDLASKVHGDAPTAPEQLAWIA